MDTNSVITYPLIHPESFQEPVDPDPKEPELNESELGGAILSHRKKNPGQFKINISTILISAVVFLMALSWYEFAVSTFVKFFNETADKDTTSPVTRLAFAVTTTVVVLALIILVYHYSYNK